MATAVQLSASTVGENGFFETEASRALWQSNDFFQTVMFKILNGFLGLGSMLPTKFRAIVEACDAARGVGSEEVIQKAQYKYMKEVSECVLRPLKLENLFFNFQRITAEGDVKPMLGYWRCDRLWGDAILQKMREKWTEITNFGWPKSVLECSDPPVDSNVTPYASLWNACVLIHGGEVDAFQHLMTIQEKPIERSVLLYIAQDSSLDEGIGMDMIRIVLQDERYSSLDAVNVACDEYQMTPLMYAVKNDRFEYARVFIENGARANAKDAYHRNVTHIAKEYGRTSPRWQALWSL